jgi:hypothetical protein
MVGFINDLDIREVGGFWLRLLELIDINLHKPTPTIQNPKSEI